MPEEPDLWPDEITVDVLSPAMILNQQSEALSRKTQGLIHGEAILDETDYIVKLLFDLVAPAVRFRRRILTIRYTRALLYPAVVTASHACHFESGVLPVHGPEGWRISAEEAKLSRVASGPDDIYKWLRAIFNSAVVRGSILSMLAKSNDIKNPPRVITEKPLAPPADAGKDAKYEGEGSDGKSEGKSSDVQEPPSARG